MTWYLHLQDQPEMGFCGVCSRVLDPTYVKETHLHNTSLLASIISSVIGTRPFCFCRLIPCPTYKTTNSDPNLHFFWLPGFILQRMSQKAVLRIRIRIRRISMFLGIPNRDPLVRYYEVRYWSGSGSGSSSRSFNHQAKIVRKTLIPTVLWVLYEFFVFEKKMM